MIEYILKINSWKFFILLLVSVVLTTFAINFLFVSDGLYYQSFGEKLATDRIANVIEQSQKWQ